MRFLIFQSIFLFLLLVCSCGYRSVSDADNNTRVLRALVTRWNDAHTADGLPALAVLYADTATVYGIKGSPAVIIARKRAFIKQYPDYRQSIAGDISITPFEATDGGYRISFLKQTRFDHKLILVPAYLLVEGTASGDWKIIRESDSITDATIIRRKQAASQASHSGGNYITGDFDGNGNTDTLYYKMIKEGDFDQGGYIFSLRFSAPGLQPFTFDGQQDAIYLVSEGDLDGKPGDEFSIFAPPNHGCIYTMYTYHLSGNKAKQLIESFLVPTYCEEMSDKDLQNRVFREGDAIYYYSVEPNDRTEDLELVKTPAVRLKD